MRRTVLYSVTLVAALASAHLAFADAAPATSSDHAPAASVATPQAAPAAAPSSAPGFAAPAAGAGQAKEVPVGFGWG